MDSNLILGIIAVCAIFSPIAVAFINNHYQLKLKKFENYEITKIKALETFTKNVGNHIVLGSGHTQRDMTNSLYGLLPFFDISNEDLNKLTDAIAKTDFVKYVQDLIPKLNEQIKPTQQSLIKHIFHK